MQNTTHKQYYCSSFIACSVTVNYREATRGTSAISPTYITSQRFSILL